MSKNYAWFVSHGICTRCYKAKARPGRVNCEACEQKRREVSREYARKRNADPEVKQKFREYMKAYQALKRKNGVCLDCKNPASPGKARCESCLERNRERVRAHRLKLKNGGDAACGGST